MRWPSFVKTGTHFEINALQYKIKHLWLGDRALMRSKFTHSKGDRENDLTVSIFQMVEITLRLALLKLCIKLATCILIAVVRHENSE